jgi:hypothetical protein
MPSLRHERFYQQTNQYNSAVIDTGAVDKKINSLTFLV